MNSPIVARLARLNIEALRLNAKVLANVDPNSHWGVKDLLKLHHRHIEKFNSLRKERATAIPLSCAEEI